MICLINLIYPSALACIVDLASRIMLNAVLSVKSHIHIVCIISFEFMYIRYYF